MKKLCLLMCCLFISLNTVAQKKQKIITIESKITGNQEQPKVISIVPWQDPADPEYFAEEIKDIGLGENNFQPLHRDSFNKEREYLQSIRGGKVK